MNDDLQHGGGASRAVPPPPPPPPPPRPEHHVGVVETTTGSSPAPLGRRVAAALFDMVPPTVAAFALGEKSEQYDVGITLENERLLLWVAITLVYFGLVELGGRSVGKVFAGLRVIDIESGATPSPGQLVKRTVLRVVDSMPFLYLVGFIAAKVDDQSRRLGDMWAGTMVVQDEDDRPAAHLVVPLIISVAVVVGSIVAIALDPGDQVGAFDYGDEVEPFARSIAASMIEGDFEAVEDALFDDFALHFGADLQARLREMSEELGQSRWPSGPLQTSFDDNVLPGENHPTASIVYATNNPRQPNQGLVLTVGDYDGDLALFGLFVVYSN